MSILQLVKQDCYMATLDIKDAYYSVSILSEHTKYLKFIHKGKLYKFMVLPNGLSPGPRKFTKLLKPPIAVLRKDGVTISIYIDDIILMGDTFEECISSLLKTIKLLLDPGFVTHEKCV